MSRSIRFCDGVARRDFLRLGTAGVFGLGLTLPELLARQARAAEAGKPTKDVSLIFLFLHGGLSHMDSWDLKPDAPAEFRGDFHPIDTNVPGIRISEHLPRTAKQMDKIALIRSFRHHNSDHGPADHYILTGYFPTAGFNPTLSPNNQRPAHGAVVARTLGPRGSVPPYVCLPKLHPSAGSAYLGPTAAPFVIDADPNAPDFAVPDLAPPAVVDASRLDARRELLARVDRFQKAAEARANHDAQAVSVFQQKAFELMTSPEAKKAFDIHAEADALRDEYGRNTLGQSCLMARRLVQAGVRCVTIDHSNWDTHDDNFRVSRNSCFRSWTPAWPRCSATWPTAACSTPRWSSSPASSAGRRASTRTPAATTGARLSPWPWAAAASRAAASSARPTPAPRSRPTPRAARKTWRRRCTTASASTPMRSSILPKAGR